MANSTGKSSGKTQEQAERERRIAERKAKAEEAFKNAKTARKSRRRRRADADPEHDYLHGMVYGESGTGKSTLLASAEEVKPMGDILLVNAEKGDKVIPRNSTIDIYDITSYKDFTNLYEYLKIHVKYRDANDVENLRRTEAKFFNEPIESIKEPKRYYTVLVDSLTEIQKLCLYQLLGIDRSTYDLSEEPDRMQIQDWGSALDMILLMVRAFRDLEMHTLFSAQRKEDEDDKKRKYYLPALQGQARQDVQGFFDFVGYYMLIIKEDRSKERVLILNPVGRFKAKNRFLSFKGDHLINPSMKDIYALHVAESN